MAEDKDEDDATATPSKSPPRTPQKKQPPESIPDSSDDDDEEEDDEDEEPRLKYVSLTKSQGSMYKGGDAVSSFLVGGDKMIIGTHNGNVHVFSLPSFTSLRVYHAHTASITAISISPYPPPLPSDADPKAQPEPQDTPSKNEGNGRSRKPQILPNIPSNSIHIATASIDGNVCVYSLLEPADVQLRKFGRPVHAVALSPNYKNDRSYVSGGKAGNLVLTVGGQAGKTSQSNTDPTASIASNWLGTIGLGANNGTDTVLHSGEGSISTIKWSLSGRFLVWVNEFGVKTIRSHLHLEANETDYAWKRIGHLDRPTHSNWQEMSGVWTARAEWIDEEGLEIEGDDDNTEDKTRLAVPARVKNGTDTGSIRSDASAAKPKTLDLKKEKVIIGWGDTVWIMTLVDGLRVVNKERRMGRAEVTSRIPFEDCIVSGVSLYTQNLLLVLAYVIPDEDESKKATKPDGTPRRGIARRQNALQPELKLVDINTREECAADTLNVSRFESLTAVDYHLASLPVMRASTKTATSRGALEVLGNVTNSIWDASLYSTKFLGNAAIDATLYSAQFSTQLFRAGSSIRSVGGPDSLGSGGKSSDKDLAPSKLVAPPNPALLTRSMKIFIQSPYDCVLAIKPTRADHITWLVENHKYEEAWLDLDAHPEAAPNTSSLRDGNSTPSTPTQGPTSTTLYDFFDDTSTPSDRKNFYSQAEKEKRIIGENWIRQLVDAGDWTKAGQICGKVLGTAHSWEHWVSRFDQANHHDEIVQFIPTEPMRPPISSWVYELLLGHYIAHDRIRIPDLLDRWAPDLFEVDSVVSTMESRLRSGEVTETTVEDGIPGRDWRILMDSLAKLYLASGRTRDALKCYIQLQDADVALALIRTHHLVDVVSDDIPGLLLLRISKQQQREGKLAELEELSIESVRLLVSEAHHGVVKPVDVVEQLKNRKDMQPFLFFYFRALWQGDTAEDPGITKSTIRDSTTHRLATEGRSLVNDFADTALRLFAEYDRALFFEFLRSSSSYDLSIASAICKEQDYIPEYVYVLAKEGRTKDALFMIIEKLDDVSQAIAFAREQDDKDLWDDLLNYSMNKPTFIRALLEEAGTAINPIALIKRIPEGLEIMGLRESLTRMIKEYELQHSISDGVARVFKGEVADGMRQLRAGQKKGVRFDMPKDIRPASTETFKKNRRQRRRVDSATVKPGHCSACGEKFEDDPFLEELSAENSEPLISFTCSHVFHLSCLLRYDDALFSAPPAATLTQNEDESDDDEQQDDSIPRLPAIDQAIYASGGGIGPKVTYAEILKGRLEGRGCPLEVHKAEKDDAWGDN